MRLVCSTTPESKEMEPPERFVPEPRGVTRTPAPSQSTMMREISSALPGSTTTPGLLSSSGVES